MADSEEIIERRASNAAMARLERAITSLTSQFASSNSSSSGSGGGISAAAPSFGTAGGAPSPPRFTNYADRQNFTKILTSFGNGALGLAGAVSMALPTTQEAVDVQALANRMRFYGGTNYNTEAKSMKAQLQTSLMGTATSPEDAALASNYASQRGLMPGLANFGAGKNYTGIMGGAALASNLTPGLGITGGVGVMAGLNDPKLVNMSRMFGIQTRNKEGTGMVDLPQIIKQLYDILAKAGPVTPENIAISAMPGNALDSILNQYFGLDPNVRSTVLAGITQLAKNKGSVSSLTSKASLTKSGASTDAIASTGFRASTELSLLQAYSGRTTTNLIGTNNVLNDIYKGVAKTATGNGASDKATQMISNLSTILETFGGARNGAGQLLVDTMFDLTGDAATGAFNGLKGGNFLGKALTVGGIGLGAYGGYKLNQKFSNSFANGSVKDPLGIGVETGVKPTNPGQLFTGAITINVSAPLGQDPYAFASAITKSLSAAM
jgi:hypothetical protein